MNNQFIWWIISSCKINFYWRKWFLNAFRQGFWRRIGAWRHLVIDWIFLVITEVDRLWIFLMTLSKWIFDFPGQTQNKRQVLVVVAFFFFFLVFCWYPFHRENNRKSVTRKNKNKFLFAYVIKTILLFSKSCQVWGCVRLLFLQHQLLINFEYNTANVYLLYPKKKKKNLCKSRRWYIVREIKITKTIKSI